MTLTVAIASASRCIAICQSHAVAKNDPLKAHSTFKISSYSNRSKMMIFARSSLLFFLKNYYRFEAAKYKVIYTSGCLLRR